MVYSVIPCVNTSQKGSVLILLVVSLAGLLGIVGLAVDLGNALSMQTRLQNAIDSAALSGAKTLNLHRNTILARSSAREAFSQHLSDNLSGSLNQLSIGFSDSLTPYAEGGLSPRFIRVSLSDFVVPVIFVKILPGIGDFIKVNASAVAGPLPIGGGEVCDITPMFVCGDTSDTDCSDGECYGLEIGSETEVCLKTGAGNKKSQSSKKSEKGGGNWKGQGEDENEICKNGLGAGNFQLLELGCGGGANCVKEAMAGLYQGCVTTGGYVKTKPGNTVGPVADGINTRFGDYRGSMNSQEAPPDLVTTHLNEDNEFWYRKYLGRYIEKQYDNSETGVANRRVVAVPVGSCDGTTNGKGSVKVTSVACFFLTRPATHKGNSQAIYGQLISDCETSGYSLEAPQAGPTHNSFGTYKIVLYKDPLADQT